MNKLKQNLFYLLFDSEKKIKVLVTVKHLIKKFTSTCRGVHVIHLTKNVTNECLIICIFTVRILPLTHIWSRMWPIIWTNLNLLKCDKFTNKQMMERLSSAFSSGELKTELYIHIPIIVRITRVQGNWYEKAYNIFIQN